MSGRTDDRRAKDLWRRLRTGGDPAARDALIVMYAPLVRYVAGRMRSALPSHVEEADLVSYGLVGLMDAVDRFDPGRGVRFETFAAPRVRGAIIDELRSLDWVPRHVRALARRIERTASQLEGRLQRAPTDGELAEALGMESDEFLDAVALISNTSLVALDEMWSLSAGGDSIPLIDTIGDRGPTDPEALVEETERRERIVAAISRLPSRERIVVSLYYYGGLTLREIAEVLDVSETRARQINAT
ncbi:MAG: FliA/WhiG family RNA polymerase sigma factor, partial [Actinomycetota bacterium]